MCINETIKSGDFVYFNPDQDKTYEHKLKNGKHHPKKDEMGIVLSVIEIKDFKRSITNRYARVAFGDPNDVYVLRMDNLIRVNEKRDT